MLVDIIVPGLGESISEVEIGTWHKRIGDPIAVDEPIVEIESEKAAVEISASAAGVLVEILKETGEPAVIDEVIGRIDTEKRASSPSLPKATDGAEAASSASRNPRTHPAEPEKSVSETPPPPETSAPIPEVSSAAAALEPSARKLMPAARRIMAEKGVDAAAITPSGPGGRILKEDVARAAASRRPAPITPPSAKHAPAVLPPRPASGGRSETRERMSRLRRTIAERLLHAKQNMAILTTFNEVDMTEVKRLRKALGAAFLEKHGVKLGFMSFFVKATVASLYDFPTVNARIEGDEIVTSGYCDIGVAIGGGKGLVVPVLRNAESMGFAEIERQIVAFGERAKKNALTIEELEGGTFTISNGGVFGSMMSTPIINPPQSGILGLHAISDRPVAINGEVVIRPIMYVALSYDHRIVDGREAVSFLKGVKDRIENPHTLLLEL